MNHGGALAIGIDLGTTYSCVGVWMEDRGRVEILVNGQGNRTTPSCVAFTNDGHLVGDAAVNQCHSNSNNTIFGAKRLIGRKFGDERVQNHIRFCPFKVVAGSQDQPEIQVKYKGEMKAFVPEQVSSMVLAQMKCVAEEFLKASVKDAVITVPAYFNDSQRRATKDAATIAGLNVLRILNEPTAAAIAYGLENVHPRYTSSSKTDHRGATKRNVLVFDLGGGTFDVSLLSMRSSGTLRVMATAGDTYLGGEDFDNRMVDHFVRIFERKHKRVMRDNAKAMRRLRTACEKAKRVLSFDLETTVDIDSLHDGIDFQSKISRAKFEDLNLDLFTKCIDTVDKCLKDACMDRGSIDEVVLVGGSTRIPTVRRLLQEYFDGKELSVNINPDEAVAHGAAVLAAKLVGKGDRAVRDLVLADVTPLSIGVGVRGGVMEVVIPRNTPIPAKEQHVFYTIYDNQTSGDISVYEGERKMAKDNNLLGKFSLRGIPPAPAGEPFHDTYEIDADGVLTVTSEHRASGNRMQITIENNRGRLSSEEIQRMVSQAEIFKLEDEARQKAAAAKSNLKSLLYNLNTRLRDGHPSLNRIRPDAKNRLEILVRRADDWWNENDDAEPFEYERWTAELESIYGGAVRKG